MTDQQPNSDDEVSNNEKDAVAEALAGFVAVCFGVWWLYKGKTEAALLTLGMIVALGMWVGLERTMTTTPKVRQDEP